MVCFPLFQVLQAGPSGRDPVDRDRGSTGSRTLHHGPRTTRILRNRTRVLGPPLVGPPPPEALLFDDSEALAHDNQVVGRRSCEVFRLAVRTRIVRSAVVVPRTMAAVRSYVVDNLGIIVDDLGMGGAAIR